MGFVDAGDSQAAQDGQGDEGPRLYNTFCYFCHGYGGDAKTLASTYLSPQPRDFTQTSLDDLSRQQMIKALTLGRPNTAMMSFKGLMTANEMEVVVDYVRANFMAGAGENIIYHSLENGWENHERYRDAFPFAMGEIGLDVPDAELTEAARRGRDLFLASCITCHDRAKVENEGDIWDTRPVSFPRGGYSHQVIDQSPNLDQNQDQSEHQDAMSGATPYAAHEVVPVFTDLTVNERRGEVLFQANCAFCHGADGTGRNWIGRFLEPHPRDLTADESMSTMTRARLLTVIREGLEGTTMPAWGGVLTADEMDAIVAYVHRAFHPLLADEPVH